MADNRRCCIGIDLGGTSLKVGVLWADYRPQEPLRLATPSKLTAEGLLELMTTGVRRLMTQRNLTPKDVLGVGIGAPGPLAISRGVILAMPNLPGIEDYPIRDLLSKELDLPAILENDANAATFGEHLCGSARGIGNVVMLTLGTGLGGGVLIDGQVLRGAHEIGAELGHIIVEAGGRLCGCGQKGCLEQYASARYISREAARRIEAGRMSVLKDVLDRTGQITSKDIVEAAGAGDALAGEVWDEAMFYLAVGCASLCRAFDPDAIILAGGMTKAGDDLMRPLKKHFESVRWKLLPEMSKIVLASLGEDAGFIGSAGLAWRAFGGR